MFFPSGLLVSFLTLKQLARGNGNINWALFYFHRWWRITPTYMLLLAIWMNLFVVWGHGPAKDIDTYYNYDQCKNEWWLYLLYINNLVPFPGSLSSVCIVLFFYKWLLFAETYSGCNLTRFRVNLQGTAHEMIIILQHFSFGFTNLKYFSYANNLYGFD